MVDSILLQQGLGLLRCELRATIGGHLVTDITNVLGYLGCWDWGSALPLVDVDLVAEPVRDDREVGSMEAEVVIQE